MRKTSTKNKTIKPNVRLAGTGACARAAELMDSLCSAMVWTGAGAVALSRKQSSWGVFLGRILSVCV